MSSDLYDRGMAIRRRVLGDDYVDRALAGADAFNEEFQQLVTEYCWGKVWARSTLTDRQRSLINLAMVSALNRSAEFKAHVRGALRNGCTVAEISRHAVAGRRLLRHTGRGRGVPTRARGAGGGRDRDRVSPRSATARRRGPARCGKASSRRTTRSETPRSFCHGLLYCGHVGGSGSGELDGFVAGRGAAEHAGGPLAHARRRAARQHQPVGDRAGVPAGPSAAPRRRRPPRRKPLSSRARHSTRTEVSPLLVSR